MSMLLQSLYMVGVGMPDYKELDIAYVALIASFLSYRANRGVG